MGKKHLIIAGHGRRRNGSFDPGATGYIKRGEHRYMKEILFPAMKKYASDKFVFHDAYNVYSYGDLLALARKHNASDVTEFHYDAFNGRARGGHVIIHSSYGPDQVDLALVDVIRSMVGVRHNHRGISGLSGRSGLANVNRARNGNLTYRMVELGFGDNKIDSKVLMNDVDEYAKKLVEAIGGSNNTNTPKTNKRPASLSFNEVVARAKAGAYGNYPERKRRIESETNFKYNDIQNAINKSLNVKTAPAKSGPSFEKVVTDTMKGVYGNYPERKRRIENETRFTYNQIQREVNRRL